MLESKWPSGDVSHGQVLWKKLRNVLLAIQMFKKLGKERNGEFKASVRAQQQQMQLQLETQQKHEQETNPKNNGNAHCGSKGELDNVSGSSLESGLSRSSSNNDEQQCQKASVDSTEDSKQVPTNSQHISNENGNDHIMNDNDNLGEVQFEIKISNEDETQEKECENSGAGIIEKQESEKKETNNETTKGTTEEESKEHQMRRRASTIVKTSTSTLQGVEQGKRY